MRKLLRVTARSVLLLIWVVALCSCFSVVSAQTASRIFQIIHLPRKAGYSKEKLNSELAALKDKEAVKKLIRYKNFPSETILVLQVNRPGNLATYWTINTSAPSDQEDKRIILQSRDNNSTRFYKLSAFKTFFKDTVAILDTLAIDLFIREDAYPDDGYILSAQCGRSLHTRTIPWQNGKLFFTKNLIDSCEKQPLAISINNRSNPGRTLASCKLVFLSRDDKERLLSIASAVVATEPATIDKDVAAIVHGYALNYYGRLSFSQLLNWLQKNKGLSSDGRY
jgi:hypothetical protein